MVYVEPSPNSGRVMQPGGVAYQGPVVADAAAAGGDEMFDVGMADDLTAAQEEQDAPEVVVEAPRERRPRKSTEPAGEAQS